MCKVRKVLLERLRRYKTLLKVLEGRKTLTSESEVFNMGRVYVYKDVIDFLIGVLEFRS